MFLKVCYIIFIKWLTGDLKMKKSYKIEGLDCANCAAKMEEAIKKIDGVISAGISFFQERLDLEASDEEFTKVLAEVETVMKKMEDVELIK